MSDKTRRNFAGENTNKGGEQSRVLGRIHEERYNVIKAQQSYAAQVSDTTKMNIELKFITKDVFA